MSIYELMADHFSAVDQAAEAHATEVEGVALPPGWAVAPVPDKLRHSATVRAIPMTPATALTENDLSKLQSIYGPDTQRVIYPVSTGTGEPPEWQDGFVHINDLALSPTQITEVQLPLAQKIGVDAVQMCMVALAITSPESA